MGRLKEKVVLVTGSAGAIGSAVADAVVELGGIAITSDLPGRDGIDQVLDVTSEEEREANEFAETTIVPPGHLAELLALQKDKDSILRFARRSVVARSSRRERRSNLTVRALTWKLVSAQRGEIASSA